MIRSTLTFVERGIYRPFYLALRNPSAAPRPGLHLVIALVGLFALAGCTTYRAKPLDRGSVEEALQVPKLDAVRIAVDKLKHPLLPPLVLDGRGGFTPDEIAVVAVVADPRLRALRAQHGVAQAQLVQAGILPNPQIGFTLDQLHGGNAATLDPTLVNGRSLGLNWEVTSLLTRNDNLTAARATTKALDLSIAWQEWQAAQDARLRAFRLLSIAERLPIARTVENDFAENVRVIRQARSLGQKTTVDLTTATLAWTQAQAERLALEQQANADRSALNLALGQPPDARVPLKPESLPPDAGADVEPATAADRLLRGLEKRRLDLMALRLGYASEEATLRAAVKAQFPKIGLSFGRANDTSDVRTRSFGVTIDLPIFDRGQGQVAVAQATRQQLFEEYVARTAEARAEVTRALADVAAVRTQLQSIDGSLPMLEQLAADTGQAYRSRNVDLLAYHEALDALSVRRLERSRLQQSLVELQLAIQVAAAQPLGSRTAQP